jgi:hypothetical protein
MDHLCPHRLASLFLGRNEDHGTRCAYHGWKFDVDGNCLDQPNLPDKLVTTRAPMFFTRNQSAALLMLASGSIFATSVPFCLRMVSTVKAAAPELPAP